MRTLPARRNLVKRLVLGFLIIAVVGAAARTIARRKLPELMEHMAEDVMPKMMDACFAQMSPDRRIFMLSHCRGMLDRVEAKYDATQQAVDRAEVA